MATSSYRWVIVAVGGLLGCVAIGSLFALPVLLVPISEDTGWSITGVSSAMTIGFVTLALASMVWGPLSDRLGARLVVLIGSALLAIGLALASEATSLVQFQMVFGLVVGGATASIFAPMMACVTGWFDTRRSLALSLVSAGIGMAPMTMAPFAAQLETIYDWRTTLVIMAGLAAVLMIPAALFVRPAPAPQGNGGNVAAASPAGASSSAMPLGQALRSRQFIVLLLTNFFCCATHAGPIFHTVSYAVNYGIPSIAAVTIYSIEGIAGMGGRVAFGMLGDRFGARRVLMMGLLSQAFCALAYLSADALGEFYAVAALFGFIYGGIMPLYAVIARENFSQRMMGAVIGGTVTAGSLGMATGPLAGGLIFDTFGNYGWLFIGSWVLGLGAFLVAMTFRPRLADSSDGDMVEGHQHPGAALLKAGE